MNIISTKNIEDILMKHLKDDDLYKAFLIMDEIKTHSARLEPLQIYQYIPSPYFVDGKGGLYPADNKFDIGEKAVITE